MSNSTQVGSLLQTIGDFINVLRKTSSSYQTTSLTEITKLARVEPMTVVAKDCLNLEYLPDVLQTLLNIFAGYYLQAVSLSARIDNVKVIKVLDRLNVDRDESGYFAALNASLESAKDIQNISMESYRFRLPTSKNRLAIESVSALDMEDKLPEAALGGAGLNKIVTESANMAVGKMIDVKISAGFGEDNKPRDIVIPVSIRLVPATIPTSSIVHILALKQEDNTLVERFHAWRAGRISFIKDLIMCQDLIDQHKAALMHDEEGVYSEIIRRANNAKKYGLLTSNPSLVSASNLFILSEESAKEVENKLGGKLSNPRIRQKAFENTYAMVICVIDRDYERVTFYYRGIAQETEVSVASIRNSSKSKGPDILDIFKSLSQGSAASF